MNKAAPFWPPRHGRILFYFKPPGCHRHIKWQTKRCPQKGQAGGGHTDRLADAGHLLVHVPHKSGLVHPPQAAAGSRMSGTAKKCQGRHLEPRHKCLWAFGAHRHCVPCVRVAHRVTRTLCDHVTYCHVVTWCQPPIPTMRLAILLIVPWHQNAVVSHGGGQSICGALPC